MTSNVYASPFRWVMMTLCVLALLGQTCTWLAPAPLLADIISDLGISIGQAGSLLTVITLVTGIFAFAGSFSWTNSASKTP